MLMSRLRIGIKDALFCKWGYLPGGFELQICATSFCVASAFGIFFVLALHFVFAVAHGGLAQMGKTLRTQKCSGSGQDCLGQR